MATSGNAAGGKSKARVPADNNKIATNKDTKNKPNQTKPPTTKGGIEGYMILNSNTAKAVTQPESDKGKQQPQEPHSNSELNTQEDIGGKVSEMESHNRQDEDMPDQAIQDETNNENANENANRAQRRRFSDVILSPENAENSNELKRFCREEEPEIATTNETRTNYVAYLRCKNENVNICELNPVKVQKEIKDQLPMVTKMMKAGRSLRLSFNTEWQRDRALSNSLIIQNMHVECSKPDSTKSRRKPQTQKYKYYVNNLPNDISDEEIAEATGAQAVIRIPNKGKPVNPAVLQFEEEKYEVTIGYLVIKLKPYIPSPTRCFNCQKFGHVAKFCRAKNAVCPNCGGRHEYENCPNKDALRCVNCNGEHSSGYKGCPEYIKIHNILRRIAYTGEKFHDVRVENIEHEQPRQEEKVYHTRNNKEASETQMQRLQIREQQDKRITRENTEEIRIETENTNRATITLPPQNNNSGQTESTTKNLIEVFIQFCNKIMEIMNRNENPDEVSRTCTEMINRLTDRRQANEHA